MARLPSLASTRAILRPFCKQLSPLSSLSSSLPLPTQSYRTASTSLLDANAALHRRCLSTSTSTSTLSLEQLILDKTKSKSEESLQCEGVVVEKTEGTLTCTGLFAAKLYQPITIASSSPDHTPCWGIAVSLEAKVVKVALLSGQSFRVTLGAKATLQPSNVKVTVPKLTTINGHVVDALGMPEAGPRPDASTIDVFARRRRSVVEHGRITEQLFTRIRAIDALYPLGFGERVALVGPHGNGKRALARDVAAHADVDQIIWVSIGQSTAHVRQTQKVLREAGVLEKTVLVHEGEGELWGRRWLAPMTGMRLAEDAEGSVLMVVDGFTGEMSRVLGDVRNEVYSHWKQPQAELFERCGNFSPRGSITCVAIFDTDDSAQSDRFKDLLNGIVDKVIECQTGLAGRKYSFETLSIGNVSAARHQHPALKKMCIRLRRLMYALNEELNAVELARAFGIDHTEERDIQHCIEHAEMLRAFFATTEEEPFASTFVALVIAANGKLCSLAFACLLVSEGSSRTVGRSY